MSPMAVSRLNDSVSIDNEALRYLFALGSLVEPYRAEKRIENRASPMVIILLKECRVPRPHNDDNHVHKVPSCTSAPRVRHSVPAPLPRPAPLDILVLHQSHCAVRNFRQPICAHRLIVSASPTGSSHRREPVEVYERASWHMGTYKPHISNL